MPIFERDCPRTYFFAESRCALSIWPFVSPRKYATMPSFVPAVYQRCLPNKSLYRSLCLCSCAARGTNPPNDTPSWERNYGIAPPVRDTKGHQVGGNGSIRGKHVQVEGALPFPFARDAQLVFGLA